jgi:RNA polymerase sigma-70 factor (ECF subfamily)
MKLKKGKYTVATDKELVGFLSDNQSNLALNELYARYGHLVLGLCLKYLKQKEDAEDLTMNIFIKLKKKSSGKSIDSFKSWLYTVSKNECLMLLRKKRFDHIEVKEELLSEDSANSKDKLNEELKYEELEYAISELKEEQAVTIRQFYLENKSYQEISAKLEISLKKVKSAIQNGKRNLRIKLEQNDLFKSA